MDRLRLAFPDGASGPSPSRRWVALAAGVWTVIVLVCCGRALLKPGTPATLRAHALWILERLGALDGAALRDAAAHAR